MISNLVMANYMRERERERERGRGRGDKLSTIDGNVHNKRATPMISIARVGVKKY